MRAKYLLILDHNNNETAQQKFISWMEFFLPLTDSLLKII